MILIRQELLPVENCSGLFCLVDGVNSIEVSLKLVVMPP